MSKPSYTFHEAADEFMKALCKYQKATLARQQSILKMNQQTLAMYKPLSQIVLATGSAVKSPG